MNVRYKQEIFKGGTRFLHTFHHPTGDSAVPADENLFLGYEAGNFSMGEDATQTWHGSWNVGFGNRALKNLTTGYYNTAIGIAALTNATTGFRNIAVGLWALSALTIGSSNTCIGYGSAWSLTEGSYNTAIGEACFSELTTGQTNSAIGFGTLGKVTTGGSNTACGGSSLGGMVTGGNNTALGRTAGRFIVGGSVPNETGSLGLFLGSNTFPLADGGTNEIVIGASAVGKGSNTVTIGNDSITHTYLKGNLNLVSYENETVYFEGNAVLN